jgi:hypothetical protein
MCTIMHATKISMIFQQGFVSMDLLLHLRIKHIFIKKINLLHIIRANCLLNNANPLIIMACKSNHDFKLITSSNKYAKSYHILYNILNNKNNHV